jgi:putative ABC transport system permease protein
MPYKGLKPNRRLRFTNEDFDYVQNRVEGVDEITGRFGIWNGLTNRGTKYGTYNIRSVHPGHQLVENTEVTLGRYINKSDINENRKVCVIGKIVRSDLFQNDEEVLGQFIKVKGILFKIVGVFDDSGGDGENRIIYLPISTAQMVFNAKEQVDQIMFTLTDDDPEYSRTVEADVLNKFSTKFRFDPQDQRAIRIRNNVLNFQQFADLFANVRVFIWFIGIGTLLAGIIGVSNIMLILVKERTKEIGIRKALGATPGSIIGLILMESVFITLVFGYIGLMLGVLVLDLMASGIEGVEFFQNPGVDIGLAISATILLVLSGALAGYIPARQATRIDPIVALRED